MSEILKVVTRTAAVSVLVSAAALFAVCPSGVVIVKGHLENPPRNPVVRVQLVYSGDQIEDSSDMVLEGTTFTIKVPFSTQSRRPLANGQFERCNRKPKTVTVTLLEGDYEYAHLSLDLAKDFTAPYPDAYTSRSEIVLHGPPDSH